MIASHHLSPGFSSFRVLYSYGVRLATEGILWNLLDHEIHDHQTHKSLWSVCVLLCSSKMGNDFHKKELRVGHKKH